MTRRSPPRSNAASRARASPSRSPSTAPTGCGWHRGRYRRTHRRPHVARARTASRSVAELREARYWTPILVLTAKDGDLDEAEALDTGADDYLTKPFSFPVLVARCERCCAARPARTRSDQCRRPAHRSRRAPGVERRDRDRLTPPVRRPRVPDAAGRAGAVEDDILAGVWDTTSTATRTSSRSTSRGSDLVSTTRSTASDRDHQRSGIPDRPRCG